MIDENRMVNMSVERAVINTAIFEPDRFGDMAERLKAEHFAHPFHQTMWDTMDSLHRGGMPIDEVFVKQGIDPKKFDEVAFLDVLAATPVSGVDAYIGDIIEKWRRRQVAMLAVKMKELAETGDSIDDAIDMTTMHLANLGNEDGEKHCMTFDEVKAHFEKVGVPPVYETGVKFIDSTLNGGFQLGQLFFLSGAKESGKAQPVDEPVLTPDGWRTIGSLTVGDYVIGSSGRAVRVLGVFPQGVKRVMRIEFKDGRFARCCDEHLWTVYDGGRKLTIMAKGIIEYKEKNGRFVSVPVLNRNYRLKVERIGYEDVEEEMVCIMVDAPDHLYVTRDYILTHNTFILTKILENVSQGHRIGFFSLEFGSRMYYENMVKKHGSKYSNPNIYLNDWAFDIAEVEREIRYQHKKNGVKFWGIDSQLRLTNKQMAGSTREMWLGDIFSRLARLAVTLDILIMIIVQVSKEGYKSDEPTVKGCVDADHEATTWLHLTKLKGEGERRSALWVKNKQTYKHPKHILEFNPWNHTFKEVKEDKTTTEDGTPVVVEYKE